MISAIRTDSSEVVSTSVPMSILLMIRHSHAKTISAMMASRTLMMVSLFMISTPFYSSYQIFQELQAWRRLHSEGLTFSDRFTLSRAKRRSATRLLGASLSFFPSSSELRFRFFRTLPALMPSLYFAKFAFSEMLSLAKILSRTPSPTAKSHVCMIIHTYTDYQRFVI